MPVTNYTVIDGELVHENRAGVEHDYVPDPLGSTVALLNSSQTQTDTYTYWPFGEVRTSTGTTATPFQFVGTLGYYRDSAQRTYVRARYLAMWAGRWLTKDPIGFGGRDLNLYRYVRSVPTLYIDPSGARIWWCKAWGRSIGHEFISTEACGAWGYRKSGLGPIGQGIVQSDDPYLEPDPKQPQGKGKSKRPSRGIPGRGKWGVTCDLISSDRSLETAFCACKDKSAKDPPFYCICVYQCEDWIQTMLDCACNAIGKKYWYPPKGSCTTDPWQIPYRPVD